MADLNVIYRIAADISGLKSGVDRAAKATEGLESMAATVGKALTAAFTVAAVVKLGKDVLDFASNLEDLSAQTGLSTTALQKFDLAFSQAGVSMESVATASAKLANNLISGDKSTVGALTKLGLSVKELKTLAPEDQFLKVADAIGSIQNPTERTYAAMQVFGKGGADLLKGLNGQLTETVAQFEKMGLVVDEQTIKQIDDFGDSMGVLGKQIIAVTAEALGPLMPMLGKFLESLIRITPVIAQGLTFAIKGLYSALLLVVGTLEKLVADILAAATHIPFLGKHLGIAADAAKWLREDARKADEAIAGMWQSTDQAGESAQNATPPLIGLGEALDANEKAAKKAAAAQRDFNNWLVMREFEDAAEQMKRLAEATRLAAENQAIYNTWLHNTSTPLETQNDLLLETERRLANFGKVDWRWLDAMDLPRPEQFQQKLGGVFVGFGDFLKTNLAEAIVKALQGGGDIVKTIGATVGSWFTRAGGPIQKSIAGMFGDKGIGKELGGALGALVPALGTLLGPALEKVTGWFKNLFGGKEKETNKIREEFVQLSGGLDALNQKAVAAGVNLTAMLNAKTPEAYKKAIDDLNAALEFQDSAMATLDETVKKYGFTIQELGPAFARQQLDKKAQELYQDFKVLAAAGVPVNSIIQKMGKSINEFTQDAIKTGTEVPAAMKPMLEQMIEHGELLDENGVAYESLEATGLTFSETMTQGFAKLIKTVDRLTEAIARGLGLALDQLPDEKNIDINIHTNRTDTGPGNREEDPNAPRIGIPEGPTGRGPTLVPAASDLMPSMLMPSTGQFAGALQPQTSTLASAGPTAQMNLTLNIDGVFSEGDLVSTVQRRVVPIIHETWNANVAGTRTQARDVLGVA